MKLHKCHALTDEKLDISNTVMKTSPKKYLCLLAHQSGVKMFSSLSNKTFKNYGPSPSSGAVRRKPVLQAVSRITNGFLDPECVFLLDEARLTLSRSMSSQNNSYWCFKNPKLIIFLCKTLKQNFVCSEPAQNNGTQCQVFQRNMTF
jgi:hypothetical protein